MATGIEINIDEAKVEMLRWACGRVAGGGRCVAGGEI
jgi:hypothetical protein